MCKNIQIDDAVHWNSLTQNKRLRSAIRDMIMEQGPDYFVTAVFNRETNFNGAQNCRLLPTFSEQTPIDPSVPTLQAVLQSIGTA